MSPFDFVNAITYNKTNLFEDPQAEKDYVPFIVNRALSYFPDTILHANEMNRAHLTPKQWQFDFYLNSIPKRKRFSKWAKKTEHPDTVVAVQEYYKYSVEKALEAMSILSQEQLEHIKQQMGKGGKS
jgi:hypothetical protein